MSKRFNIPVLENSPSSHQEELIDAAEARREQAEFRSQKLLEGLAQAALRSAETTPDGFDNESSVERSEEGRQSGHEAITASERLSAFYGVQERPSDYEGQKEYDLYHTPEAREMSSVVVGTLLERDPAFHELLSDAAEGAENHQVVEAISHDSDLRLQVAGYLMDKLDFLVEEYPQLLPERVINNAQKRTDAKKLPVRRYSSREYVVYLALEKLSGGFRPDSESDIEYNEHGVAVQGQHRSAADLVLQQI